MVATVSEGLVTLTPSPALDRTYQVGELLLGEVNRALNVTEEFAGKGVNVSRNLALDEIVAPAVVPLSARDAAAIDPDPLLRLSDCSGRLRVNITAIDSSGETTKINQSPSDLSEAEWGALVDLAAEEVQKNSASWLLVAGSFPKVAGAQAPVEAISSRIGSVKVALDTSGSVFAEWARSGRVDFVKPNVKELGEAVGRELATLGEVQEAAREVASWGVSYVMVSMGADGFLGFASDEFWWASCQPVEARNTIGAGDASVSGFFASLLREPDRVDLAVSNAARWGGQKVQQATSQLQHLTNLPEVAITQSIDTSRPVTAD